MKLNLVLDASGIYYRSLFTIGAFGAGKGEKLLDTKKSQGIFMRKLATDFSSLVREIDEPCRTIVCLDSSSWRKSILIEDGGYKDGREEKKQESPVNWKAFYELTDNFSKLLSQKGYIISKIPGAEADDLLFFWSKKLNQNKENVILITGDRDLLQVVGKHDNGSWTIALDPVSKRKKISLTQETLDFELPNDNIDIFDTSTWSSSEDILEKITKNYEINIVNPRKISVMKVILGDGGDSVPPVITWKDKNNPSMIRKMTENNFQKVLIAVKELENASWKDLIDDNLIENISIEMENIKKIEVNREIVRKNIERNSKLVILSEDTIPSQIFKLFEDAHTIIPNTIAVTNRDAILNGSEWWTSDKTTFIPKSYDLFSE